MEVLKDASAGRRSTNQKEFHRRLSLTIEGLHRTAVGLIERGRSIPRLDTLLVVSEHLGVAMSELLEGLKH
jgi:transcriptional regulator with XRE-family HTH domain